MKWKTVYQKLQANSRKQTYAKAFSDSHIRKNLIPYCEPTKFMAVLDYNISENYSEFGCVTLR